MQLQEPPHRGPAHGKAWSFVIELFEPADSMRTSACRCSRAAPTPSHRCLDDLTCCAHETEPENLGEYLLSGWRLEPFLTLYMSAQNRRTAGLLVDDRGVDVVSKCYAGPKMRAEKNEPIRYGHFELIEIISIARRRIG